MLKVLAELVMTSVRLFAVTMAVLLWFSLCPTCVIRFLVTVVVFAMVLIPTYLLALWLTVRLGVLSGMSVSPVVWVVSVLTETWTFGVTVLLTQQLLLLTMLTPAVALKLIMTVGVLQKALVVMVPVM